MLDYLILAGIGVYLPLAFAALWATNRRPELGVRLWIAALAVAVVLVALAVADQNWLLVPLWALNAALAVVNLRLAREAKFDREAAEFWKERFCAAHRTEWISDKH